MRKRIGIIDLGTNTFNLLIADVDELSKEYAIVLKEKLPVKLAEGGITKGYIEEVPFKRGINALIEHSKIIKCLNATHVIAFATSAIRDARNGSDFIKEAKEKTGIDVQVISGDREAELIYYGVKEAVYLGSEPSLMMDIGGGSVEFIIANRTELLWKESFRIGAARLLEKFAPSDPITHQEIEAISNYVKAQITPLIQAVQKFPIHDLIGCAGSFESLTEMIGHQFYVPKLMGEQTEYTYNMEYCEYIGNKLLKSTKAERLLMPGLTIMRVDMMVICTILLNVVLELFSINKMRLSTYSLKEGVLREYIQNPQLTS